MCGLWDRDAWPWQYTSNNTRKETHCVARDIISHKCGRYGWNDLDHNTQAGVKRICSELRISSTPVLMIRRDAATSKCRPHPPENKRLKKVEKSVRPCRYAATPVCIGVTNVGKSVHIERDAFDLSHPEDVNNFKFDQAVILFFPVDEEENVSTDEVETSTS